MGSEMCIRDRSTQSVAGIARGIYDRIFKFLVEKCNQTLVDPTTKKSVFIGVLDIAGALAIQIQNPKFAIFLEYENPHSFFHFSFRATLFRPRHSLGKKIK